MIGKVVGSNPGTSKATLKQQQWPVTQFILSILLLFASTRLFWLKVVQSFKNLGPVSGFGHLRFGKKRFGKMTGTEKMSQLFPFESFFRQTSVRMVETEKFVEWWWVRLSFLARSLICSSLTEPRCLNEQMKKFNDLFFFSLRLLI